MSLVLAVRKGSTTVLLSEQQSPEGRLGLPAFPAINDDAQIREQFTEQFHVQSDELISWVCIGETITPHWGHASATSSSLTLYGAELSEASAQQVSDASRASHSWQPLAALLARWNAAQLQLAPPASHVLELLQTHATIAALRSAVQRDGLRLSWCYAPRLEIVPLVSRTLPPFSRTNTVLLRSQQDLLVVDPGAAPEAHAELERLVQERAAGGARVTILLTHHHHDHVMGLACLERACPDAVVLCHPQTLARVRTTLKCQPASNHVLRIGEVELSVLFTPGHTDGHLVVFEPRSRTLVAGDHVVGVGSAVLDPECGDMAQYVHSTRLLLDLRPQVVYPAHGPPCLDGVTLLSTYLAHREQREAAILASYQRGNREAEQIVRDVYTDVPTAFHQMAARNVELHLRKLRQEARL